MRNEAARPTERQVDLGPFINRLASRAQAHAVAYLEGRSFFIEINEGKVVVGRSEEADVQLPTPTMSRRHFELRWNGDQLSLRDGGSMNGTFVNGARIEKETQLVGGDQITAGDALLVIGITSPQPFLQSLRPSEVFEERLGAALLRASRLGRMVALVRLHSEGQHDLALQGLSQVIGALPGTPILRAIGPLDFHLFVDEAAEQVRPLCASLEARSIANGVPLSCGVALFPREAQDRVALIAAADRGLTKQREQTSPPSGGPIAVDPATARVFSLVDRIAPTDGTVLIIGETGAGKEVVARAIHDRSLRASGPFVPVNCGGIPSTMLASELFGHEKGAFTGAQERRAGLFEAAQGGTLFLDEIAEIPLADQAHLLRAIESRSIARLGGTHPISLDIRIIAATNRQLRDLVQQGRFRQDLFFRLDVLSIVVPALRDRPADIAPLADRFLAELCPTLPQGTKSLAPGAIAALQRHSWPGNVRELRNVLERLALLSEGSEISEIEVAETLYGSAVPDIDTYAETDLKSLLATVERAAIERALEACGGNQTLAAQKLGISRRTLIYRMRSHDIPGPRSG